MGTSSSKVPDYEIVEQQQQQQAPTSDTSRPSASGSFSPPSQGLLQPASPNLHQWAPVQQAPPPPLLDGWDFLIDPATGYPYFYNTRTRVSQWQDPRGPGFSLPNRSDATNLGQRRQVIPPWEGGPADVDPLLWSLPPGWNEQHDQATNQRYYVNYDAHIVSYNDPRLEISKAYAQGPSVERDPVHYPPPVIGRPVDDQPKPFEYPSLVPPPTAWPRAQQASTSYLPPPPPLKKNEHSLWFKLGYRHGVGRGGRGGVNWPVFLFGDHGFFDSPDESRDFPGGSDGPNVPDDGGYPGASSSSSSDDGDDSNDEGNDVEMGGDTERFSLGQNNFSNDGFGVFDLGVGGGGPGLGVGGGSGAGRDLAAVDEYGQTEDGGPGDTSVILGTMGDGGNVSGVHQQPFFGFWQSQAKAVYLHGWDDGLKSLFKGRTFFMLDPYTKIVILLTVLVGSYFGVGEGLLSFLVAFGTRLIVLMCKRAKMVKGQQKRSGRRFCERIRLVFKKKGSTLVQLQRAAVSQCTQIQAWFYEHLYEHPLVRVRMLTEKDGARPLYSRLHSRAREITIVTQASADRLPAIEAMAKTWGGVMCVAIHVRTQTELKQIYPRLCSLHEQIEANALCRLYVCVAKEENLSTDEEAMAALYPINAMRNMALSMATTELVFILDADFVPSMGMHDLLTGDETAYSEIVRMATVERQMLVVPAFEAMTGNVKEIGISQINYPTQMCELREQWKEGSVKAFHCSHFPRGHEPTDYEAFFHPSSLNPYRVQYREFYEPYAICAREVIPRFDARFRGYGMNKISHAYHCAAIGMGFSVLPRVFVWSFPHCKSPSWMYTFGRSKDPLQKLRIVGLYRRFKSEMQSLHGSRKKTMAEGHSFQAAGNQCYTERTTTSCTP